VSAIYCRSNGHKARSKASAVCYYRHEIRLAEVGSRVVKAKSGGWAVAAGGRLTQIGESLCGSGGEVSNDGYTQIQKEEARGAR
jgi:hypothetical protein